MFGAMAFASSRRREYISAIATNSAAFGRARIWFSKSCPRPPTPIIPTGTRLLAPSICEGEYIKAAVAIAACLRDSRRGVDVLDMLLSVVLISYVDLVEVMTAQWR